MTLILQRFVIVECRIDLHAGKINAASLVISSSYSKAKIIAHFLIYCHPGFSRGEHSNKGNGKTAPLVSKVYPCTVVSAEYPGECRITENSILIKLREMNILCLHNGSCEDERYDK